MRKQLPAGYSTCLSIVGGDQFCCFPAFFRKMRNKEDIMSDAHHDHHPEDHTVCYRVALFFVAVVVAITVIALFN